MRAIVLRQVDYRDSDRIATLLTAERGRVDVRIPRARASRKRFGGLDLFVVVEADFLTRPGAPRLRDAQPVRSFDRIRADVVRLALASYAAELLGQAAPEEHASPDLFRLAEAALASLDRPDGEDVGGLGWARAFELKLLHVLGCKPELRRCAATGAPASGTDLYWSPASGGVLCGGARETDPRARPIAADVVSALDRALHTPLLDQASVPWTARQGREAADAMRPLISDHVGPRDRALQFLQQVLGVFVVAGLAVGLAACPTYVPPADVRVQGYLFSTPQPLDADGNTNLELQVQGSSGSAWSDAGELLAEATNPFSDFGGWYRFDVLPPSAAVHLVFEPPASLEADDGAVDYVTTVVSGRTASDDLIVDPGTFHLWPRADAEGWTADWFDALGDDAPQLRPAFDPELPGEGGAAVGRIVDAEDHLGLRLVFRDETGFDREAWYTDADGAAIEGEGISADGGFAAFGLKPGPIDVLLFDADGSGHDHAFVTRAAEDGITSLFGFVVVE